MNQFYIVLFSKYSQGCKKFADTITSSGIDINFNYICIDNKEIRDKITKSNDIEIKNVPCLLIASDNGNLDKYEGQDCFIWLNDILQQHQKAVFDEQQKQLQQQMQQMQQLLKEKEQQQEIQHTSFSDTMSQMTSIDELDPSKEDENLLFDNTIPDNETVTMIGDDLPFNSTFRDIDVSSAIKQPTKKSNESTSPVKKPKKREGEIKRENLLNAAMQMQKSREMEDKSTNNRMPSYS